MLKFIVTSVYAKDCRRICQREFYNKQKHLEAEFTLVSGEAIPEKYRDHKLKGPFLGYKLIHIDGQKSDWLLMYRIKDDILSFERTGTHRDFLNIE